MLLSEQGARRVLAEPAFHRGTTQRRGPGRADIPTILWPLLASQQVLNTLSCALVDMYCLVYSVPYWTGSQDAAGNDKRPKLRLDRAGAAANLNMDAH